MRTIRVAEKASGSRNQSVFFIAVKKKREKKREKSVSCTVYACTFVFFSFFFLQAENQPERDPRYPPGRSDRPPCSRKFENCQRINILSRISIVFVVHRSKMEGCGQISIRILHAYGSPSFDTNKPIFPVLFPSDDVIRRRITCFIAVLRVICVILLQRSSHPE